MHWPLPRHAIRLLCALAAAVLSLSPCQDATAQRPVRAPGHRDAAAHPVAAPAATRPHRPTAPHRATSPVATRPVQSTATWNRANAYQETPFDDGELYFGEGPAYDDGPVYRDAPAPRGAPRSGGTPHSSGTPYYADEPYLDDGAYFDDGFYYEDGWPVDGPPGLAGPEIDPFTDLSITLADALRGLRQTSGFLLHPVYPPHEALPEQDPPGAMHCRTWFVSADATLLDRQRSRHMVTSYELDIAVINGQIFLVRNPVLSTQQLKFNPEPGMRLTIGRHLGRDILNRDLTAEFTYFGLNEWSETASVTGTRLTSIPDALQAGSLQSPFGNIAAGFSNADTHALAYSSDLNNFEWNLRLRRRLADQMVVLPDGTWIPRGNSGGTHSVLAGIRYLSSDERFRYTSQGSIIENLGLPNQVINPISGEYQVSTSNNLVGLQLGGELLQENCLWYWGFRGKAGLFVNFADQSSRINIVDDSGFQGTVRPFVDEFDGDGENLAFIGELGFTLAWRPVQNVTLRAAYDFMWVQGLALAPEQLVFDNSPYLVNRGGALLFQGVSLGFEWIW